MAGLTESGFERKRLSEIKADIEAALKVQFGSDIDLRSASVFGQIVGIMAEIASDLWEEAENVYLAFDPDYAEGISLDSLAALSGLVRIPATKTAVDAVLFGATGTTIPASSEARSSETGDVYELKEAVTVSNTALARATVTVGTVSDSTDYTITLNGTAYTVSSDASATEAEIAAGFDAALSAVSGFVEVNDDNEIIFAEDDKDSPFSLVVTSNLDIDETAAHGEFLASVAGALLMPSGDLSEIQTTVAGWESVINPADGTIGRDIESDSDFRFRRRLSVSFPATATVDSLLARFLQVEDITAAKVYENNTDVTDGNGVPAHSIWAIIKGGTDAEIAEIIYNTRAGGIGTHGDVSVDYTSDSGQDYPMKFERPTNTQVYIDISIDKKTGYSDGSPDLIKAAIVAWADENLSIGDMLCHSRLYTPINSVKGFETTSLTIGTSPSPTGEVSLMADIDEIFDIQTANINITVST